MKYFLTVYCDQYGEPRDEEFESIGEALAEISGLEVNPTNFRLIEGKVLDIEVYETIKQVRVRKKGFSSDETGK